jgi:hypothetical protein
MPVFPADAGKSGMREGGKIRGLPRLGNLTSILTFLLFYAFAHAPCRGLCFVFCVFLSLARLHEYLCSKGHFPMTMSPYPQCNYNHAFRPIPLISTLVLQPVDSLQ